MSAHRITLLWRGRWASSEFHRVEFAGPDREILQLLNRYDVEEYPFVEAHIDNPNVAALDVYRWEACLRVQGERAIFEANHGNWWVAILPGVARRAVTVEFMDPLGSTTTQPADLIIPRDLGFQAIRAWLCGRDRRVDGLDWDLLRNC